MCIHHPRYHIRHRQAATSDPDRAQTRTALSRAKRINGIAAIVNDDIITFREVLRESQAAILDAQKKGLVDDAARHNLRTMVLDRLIEKLLTEQKVRSWVSRSVMTKSARP